MEQSRVYSAREIYYGLVVMLVGWILIPALYLALSVVGLFGIPAETARELSCFISAAMNVIQITASLRMLNGIGYFAGKYASFHKVQIGASLRLFISALGALLQVTVLLVINRGLMTNASDTRLRPAESILSVSGVVVFILIGYSINRNLLYGVAELLSDFGQEAKEDAAYRSCLRFLGPCCLGAILLFTITNFAGIAKGLDPGLAVRALTSEGAGEKGPALLFIVLWILMMAFFAARSIVQVAIVKCCRKIWRIIRQVSE